MSIASELTPFVSILGDRGEATGNAECMLTALSQAGVHGSDAIRIAAAILAERVAEQNTRSAAYLRKFPCEVSDYDRQKIRARADHVRRLRELAEKHTRKVA